LRPRGSPMRSVSSSEVSREAAPRRGRRLLHASRLSRAPEVDAS
jgi:hypothetical protein